MYLSANFRDKKLSCMPLILGSINVYGELPGVVTFRPLQNPSYVHRRWKMSDSPFPLRWGLQENVNAPKRPRKAPVQRKLWWLCDDARRYFVWTTLERQCLELPLEISL